MTRCHVKVSVVIPVYNVEKYLRQCLDSVVSQTLKDIEIICVNDGSTDSSPAILEEYARKDSRISIIDKENGGLSSARNAGLDIAQGQYIGFVDSDDYIEPDTYETAVQYMVNDDDVDIVCYGTNVFYEGNLGIDYSMDEYMRIGSCGKTALNNRLRLNVNVSACNKLYKKSIIDKYKLRFPVGMIYEDMPFYWQYITVAETAYFDPRKFYNYIRRLESIMGNTIKCNFPKAMDHLYIIRVIFDFWAQNNMLRQNADILRNVFSYCFEAAYKYSPAYNREKILEETTRLVNEMKLYELCPKSALIKNLHLKKYSKIACVGASQNTYWTPFWRNLFSITDSDRHKVITVLGIKIQIRSRLNTIKTQLDKSCAQVDELRLKAETQRMQIHKLTADVETFKNKYDA